MSETLPVCITDVCVCLFVCVSPRGIFYQGYYCSRCGTGAHKECLEVITICKISRCFLCPLAQYQTCFPLLCHSQHTVDEHNTERLWYKSFVLTKLIIRASIVPTSIKLTVTYPAGEGGGRWAGSSWFVGSFHCVSGLVANVNNSNNYLIFTSVVADRAPIINTSCP